MPAQFLEEDLDQLDDIAIITKRAKYLKTCREQLRKRWLSEYLRALEERHQKVIGSKEVLPKIGSVVMLTDSMTIKPKWVLGRIVAIGSFHVKVGQPLHPPSPIFLKFTPLIHIIKSRTDAQFQL